MGVAWFERNHWIMPLYPFMRQVKLGQNAGLYVYYVRLADQYIYVGQTYNGVRLRLWKHVSQSSPLAEWLIKNEFTEPEPECGVIRVSDCLDMAERYYISLFDPQINIVRYKTSLIVPPIERAQSTRIDISAPTWHAEYGAITGLKGGYAGPLLRAVEGSGAEQEGDDFDFMTRLYQRAYREPNRSDPDAS